MRWQFTMVAGALALAACGSDPDTPKTAEEIAEAADDLIKPTPGLYRSTATITEFDIPGLPAEQAAQMRDMMGGASGQSSESCVTQEQADEGFRDVARQLGEGQGGVKCEFAEFEAAGSNLDAALTCTGPAGVNVAMDMDGTIEKERSEIAMSMTQKGPGIPGGEVRVGMQIKSERIGDCP